MAALSGVTLWGDSDGSGTVWIGPYESMEYTGGYGVMMEYEGGYSVSDHLDVAAPVAAETARQVDASVFAMREVVLVRDAQLTLGALAAVMGIMRGIE